MAKKIRLEIIGKDENIPRGVWCEGADCNNTGKYYYVLQPLSGKSALLWEGKGRDKSYKLWTGTSGSNGPREPEKAVEGSKGINKVVGLYNSVPTNGQATTKALKGSWVGYLECTAKGPKLGMYRKIAPYATLALASDLDGTWEYGVVVDGDRWFTAGVREEKGGFKSYKTALKAGMRVLLAAVAAACTIEHTHTRPTSSQKASKTKEKAKKTIERAKTAAVAKQAKVGKKAMTKAEKIKAAEKAKKERVALKDAPKAAKGLRNARVEIRKGNNAHYMGKVIDVTATGAKGGVDKKAGGPVLVIQLAGVEKTVRVRAYDKEGKLTVRRLGKGAKLEKRTAADIKEIVTNLRARVRAKTAKEKEKEKEKAVRKHKAAQASKPKVEVEIPKGIKKYAGRNVKITGTAHNGREGKVVAVEAKTPAVIKKVEGKASGPFLIIQVAGQDKPVRVRAYTADGKMGVGMINWTPRTWAEIKAGAKKKGVRKKSNGAKAAPKQSKAAASAPATPPMAVSPPPSTAQRAADLMSRLQAQRAG